MVDALGVTGVEGKRVKVKDVESLAQVQACSAKPLRLR